LEEKNYLRASRDFVFVFGKISPNLNWIFFLWLNCKLKVFRDFNFFLKINVTAVRSQTPAVADHSAKTRTKGILINWKKTWNRRVNEWKWSWSRVHEDTQTHNRPNCVYYNHNLSLVAMQNKVIDFCKLIHVNFAVLEMSKSLIYEYHYNVITKQLV